MYYIVFFGVLVIVAVIILALQSSKKTEIKNRQKEFNTKVNSSLKDSNFNISKTFFLDDYATIDCSYKIEKKQIIINEKEEKIIFPDYDKNRILTVNFNEIVNYEIYENGGVDTSGAVFGGVLSGIFASQSTGVCKDLKLIVRFKNYNYPQVTYELVTGYFGLSKSSEQYRIIISKLQEVVSFLEVIKNSNR